MTPARLVLIEGITGSGKSTTAQRLWLHLCRHGRPARWIYEHDTAHPIWPPDEQSDLCASGSLDPSFVAEVLPSRWRAFATDCAATPQVSIIESALFQSTVGFLLAMGVGEPCIGEHVMAVAEAVAPLAPALILFRPGDVATALRAACADREVDDYQAALIAHIGATPYGKAHGVRDFTGLVRFYERWSLLVDALAARVPMRRLVLDPGLGDWPSRERRIATFLGLPEMREDCGRIEGVARFRGRYADARTGDTLVVAGDEHGLYLDGGRPTRLIPARGNRFHVAALCAELSFGDETGGRFQRLDFTGNLPGLSQVWLRTEDER